MNTNTFWLLKLMFQRLYVLHPIQSQTKIHQKEKVGEAESVLTHIRNAFAHGMTYFFDNRNVLLEDKDQRGIITARIILKMQTLLDWITLIDREQRYYVLHETEK